MRNVVYAKSLLLYSYTFTKRLSPLTSLTANTSILYFFLGDSTVKVEKEVLMFDRNDVTSAVGGAMGLFMGLSCLSIVQFIMRTFRQR